LLLFLFLLLIIINISIMEFLSWTIKIWLISYYHLSLLCEYLLCSFSSSYFKSFFPLLFYWSLCQLWSRLDGYFKTAHRCELEDKQCRFFFFYSLCYKSSNCLFCAWYALDYKCLKNVACEEKTIGFETCVCKQASWIYTDDICFYSLLNLWEEFYLVLLNSNYALSLFCNVYQMTIMYLFN